MVVLFFFIHFTIYDISYLFEFTLLLTLIQIIIEIKSLSLSVEINLIDTKYTCINWVGQVTQTVK